MNQVAAEEKIKIKIKGKNEVGKKNRGKLDEKRGKGLTNAFFGVIHSVQGWSY